MDETTEAPEMLNPQAPTEAQGGPEDEATPEAGPSLPPQYATGGSLGFFTRTTEVVPTAQAVGPDGAIYVAELTGLPYPEGYARVLRVEDPGSTSGFDGAVPSGVAQTYASGFDQIHSLAFDPEGSLFALEYQVASEVYDPTVAPSELPPSTLVKVGADGTRDVISGAELKLANYVIADPETNDVYVTINNTEVDDGQVLRYSENADGSYGVAVVADGLESPRGIRFGPDGALYVLEQGEGTAPGDPAFDEAPVVQLIPGLVAQRGGYSGAITRIDLDGGDQERIFEGLPSFQEFNPQTGEDRVFGVGVRGFDIDDEGNFWIASGGGLSNATAAAAGVVGEDLRGLLKLEGLLDGDPSDAEWTEKFDAVSYAGRFGPDGATTLFNTQSNLNDVTVGDDGNLYAVDAARNVLYEISGADGETVESVTVLQKRPPALTPPQYAAVLQNGGDPAADYSVEINDRTYKGANALPDTPGRQQALVANGEAPVPPFDPNFVPPPRGEDAAGATGDPIGDAAGGAGVPGDFSGLGEPPANLVDPGSDAPATTEDGTPINYLDGEGDGGLPVGVDPGDVQGSVDATAPEPPFTAPDETPDGTPVEEIDGATENDPGEEITGFDPNDPPEGGLPNVPGPVADGPLLPGPVDPVSPPVLANNKYAPYFDPFFGTYAPARGDEPALPKGDGGAYQVDQVFVFGDRLTEDGGRYGKAAVAEAAGVDLPIDEAPYSPYGNYTDGRNWVTYLERILGVAEDDGAGGEDTNFSYLDATARPLVNPTDPLQPETELTNFAGQIDAFEDAYGTFDADDLVVVSFGGNDLTLPPGDLAPEEAAMMSLQATVENIARLASLGAENFLVANLVDVEIVPIFSDPAFQEALGVPPGFFGPVIEAYNAALEGALDVIEGATDLDVKLLDVNALFEAIVEEPEAYGFLNTEEPVLVTPPNPGVDPVYNPAIVGQDPAVQHATLFLDALFSPTALAQSIIAETARDVLLGRGGEEQPATGGEGQPPTGGEVVATIAGTDGRDFLKGTDGDDVFDAGGSAYDRMTGGAGDDTFVFGAEAANGAIDQDVIWDYATGEDVIRLEAGARVRDVTDTELGVVVRLEGDGDKIHVRGGAMSDAIEFQIDAAGDTPLV